MRKIILRRSKTQPLNGEEDFTRCSIPPWETAGSVIKRGRRSSQRRFIPGMVLVFCLNGCATYSFHKGIPPYDKGYVVSRGDDEIPEYTLGRNKSVPDLALAKERFRRRKDIVEDYAKKLGLTTNRFKAETWDRVIVLVKAVGGILYLPVVMVSDYRYEHEPAYRQRVDIREAQEEALEKERLRSLRQDLFIYIQEDLAKEESSVKK